jgi:hypothetical protein
MALALSQVAFLQIRRRGLSGEMLRHKLYPPTRFADVNARIFTKREEAKAWGFVSQ